MNRVYLDWNATAPLRPEARAAMAAAMDVAGNPSSVHAEGRAARGIVERARAQVAEASGCAAGDVVFTSGATEAAALALAGRGLRGAAVEHDCVAAWVAPGLAVDGAGRVRVEDRGRERVAGGELRDRRGAGPAGRGWRASTRCRRWARWRSPSTGPGRGRRWCRAHKLGGPKGVGALLLAPGVELAPGLRGGGQEMGRRAGTENVIGIAGFGAAAQAAAAEVAAGVWEAVSEVRDILEEALASAAPDLTLVGKDTRRLPNTSCLAVAGWKGETQVMQMDLAGFAVSAGSACSSGKVRTSRVLTAMGLGPEVAGSAIRVSIGPGTTRDDVLAFAGAWERQYRRFCTRAA